MAPDQTNTYPGSQEPASAAPPSSKSVPTGGPDAGKFKGERSGIDSMNDSFYATVKPWPPAGPSKTGP